MSNGHRTLNDLNPTQFMSTPVSAPMPQPAMPYMPTPKDVSMQFFGQMDVAAHARFGYQQIGQFNQGSPVGLGGQYSPSAGMMMSPGMSIFRPPPTPMPPPLMTNPGVTASFHNQMDIGTQQALGAAGAYLDPSRGAHTLARRNAAQAGGYVGAGIGAVAGGFFGGGVGALKGASWGNALGDMFGGAMASVPVLGNLMAWGEKEEAQALSNMAGVQFGTMGRVSMGSRDMGLGGRGINAQSSMQIGQNLQKFSNQMAGAKPTAVGGGTFNEADIRNLVSASADSGLLDAATNMDQIEGTVKKVMTLVGRLGKLTGDPDFRNNIRELGKMKALGFEMDQAVDALAGMSRYGVASGMSRSQLMNQAVEPAMTRFAAAGLAPGLGVMHGAYGAAQGRMQAGIGSAVQQSLMGDVGQRVTESNAAFLSGHAKMLLPNLFAAKDGQITLDPAKINEIATAGMIDLRQTAATGRQTMVETAQKVAEQRAGKEGREVRAGEFRDILGEMTSRQSEWLSELGMKMSPEQTMRANLAMAAGLQKQGLGQWESLMSVSGGDPMQARMLLNTATDPKYHERNMAQLDNAIKKAEGDANKLGRARATKWADEYRGTALYKGFREIGRGISDGFTDEVGVGDLMDAEEEARNIEMQNEMTTSGTRTFRQTMAGGKLSKRMVELNKKTVGTFEGGLDLGDRTLKNDLFGITTADISRTGDVGLLSKAGNRLSETEMIRMQRMTGEYGTLGGWLDRTWLGDEKVLGGRVSGDKRAAYDTMMKAANKSAKVVGAATKRSAKDQQKLEGQISSKFRALGLDSADVMATIKTDLVRSLKKAGGAGKATTSEQLLGMVESSLSGYKDDDGNPISPDKIKEIMSSDPAMMQEVFTKFGLEEGGAAAKGSIMTAGHVGTAFSDYTTTDNLANAEDLQEAMNDGMLAWLEDTGVIDSVNWETGLDQFDSVGEREAFAAIHDALGGGEGGTRGGAEQAYITALYAKAQGGGSQAKNARRQIEDLTESGGDKFRSKLSTATAVFNKLDTKGKKSLGKYMDMFHREATKAGVEISSGEDMIKVLEQAQAGKGPLAHLATQEKFKAILSTMKGGGKVALEEGEFGSTGPSKEVDDLKKEKGAAEDLHKLWTAPGGIASKFDSGMGKLEKATQSLAVAAVELSKRLP